MNFKPSVITIFLLTILFNVQVNVQAENNAALCKSSSNNAISSWWSGSILSSENPVFNVEAENYSYSFDYNRLTFSRFDIKGRTSSSLPLRLSIGVVCDNKISTISKASPSFKNCQIIENGRHLNHRFINNLPDFAGVDMQRSGLDIVSWNDRVSFSLQADPTDIKTGSELMVRLFISAEFKNIEQAASYVVFRSDENVGYVIFKSNESSTLGCYGTSVASRQMIDKEGGNANKSGLVIYPLSDVDANYQRIVAQEMNPVAVTATHTTYYPTEQSRVVDKSAKSSYDKAMGWHNIELPMDRSRDPVENNGLVRSVKFTLENYTDSESVAHLNFSQSGSVLYTPGISGMIRDMNGDPTGIPIQLSKNWHRVDRTGYADHIYRGGWFHGITTIKIPAQSSVSLEYLHAGALWGGLPASSHAQLSLVGWGGNQLWEQSAMGAWSENICYEPELCLGSAPVTDVRPLFISSKDSGEKWKWSANVGGADILHVKDANGARAIFSDVKSTHIRNCPNLSEVVYSGTMLEGAVDYNYTTQIMRSDDFTRGLYKIKMSVNKDVEIDKIDIFQLSAELYSYVDFAKITSGDNNGANYSRSVTPDFSINSSQSVEMSGAIPWVFLSEATLHKNQVERYRPANKAVIVRRWNTTLAGEKSSTPYWREYASAGKSKVKRYMHSYVALKTKDDITQLKAGDSVDVELEMIILPDMASSYYGTNRRFEKAMESATEGWEIVLREANGKDISVTTSVGSVVANYPTKIETEGDRAEFTVNGGVGYLPITFTGLSSYSSPTLYFKSGKKLIKVDQSTFGNDFWQTDYNSKSKTWEITYNVEIESYLKKGSASFVFEINSK